MDENVLVGLIARLRAMESGDVNTLDNFYPNVGICNNLNIDSDDGNYRIEGMLKGMFKSWPEFSGCTTYPIGRDTQDGYYKFYKFDNKGKWLDNDYCNSRRRLAGHLANEFEKLLTAQRG